MRVLNQGETGEVSQNAAVQEDAENASTSAALLRFVIIPTRHVRHWSILLQVDFYAAIIVAHYTALPDMWYALH